MEITPQLIRETTFHEALRGYNRDEVDDYKHRWAEAVAQLQGRLIEAIERAERAESRVVATGGRSESEDVLRRTLVLAQRTADAAIADSQEQAAEILSEAQAKSTAVLDEAEVRAQRMVDAAESRAIAVRTTAEADARALTESAEIEARRVIESARSQILAEVVELERRRDLLTAEVAQLTERAGAEREKLDQVVREIEQAVEAHIKRANAELDRLRERYASDVDALAGLQSARHRALTDATSALRAILDSNPIEVVDEQLVARGDIALVAGGPPSVAIEPDDEFTPSDVHVVSPSALPATPVTLDDPSESAGSLEIDVRDSTVARASASARVSPVAQALASTLRASERHRSLAYTDEDDDETPVEPPEARYETGDDELRGVESLPLSDSFAERLRSAVDSEADEEGDRALAFFESGDDEPRRRFGRRK